MAFTAVISLKDTIRRLLNSPRISLASPTRQTLEFTYDRVHSLQEALRRYDDVRNNSKGVMASDARIREHARGLEDAIESQASAQFLSQSQIHATLCLNLHHLAPDFDRFAETAMEMEEDYIIELNKPYAEEEAAAAAVIPLPIIDSGEDEFEMVGLSDQFHEIRRLLIENVVSYDKFKSTIVIHGMAGIGKSKLAKKLFHDSLVKQNFQCRALVTLAARSFITLGSERDLEEILQAIVAQVDLDNGAMSMDGDEDLQQHLKISLKGRKFLIVLDGVSDSDLFYQVLQLLPLDHNEGRILITSISPTNFDSFYIYKIRFMNHEESWDLLRKKVFGEGECPYPLVKPGKKISQNCEGLPLLILAVAELLDEAPKNPKYWNEVAEKQNSVFEDALDHIDEVLLPTYQRIPQYAKMNFLYMGAFPRDYIIKSSRLGNLWWAEGFYDLHSFNAPHILASCNLVVVREISTITGRTKACSLHCGYRHIAKREAENNKLFHVLNSCADCSIERVESHRCLAIHQNVLFAIKDVHDSIASVATVRSVLCMGPYHPYQVPICSDWELLRLLDALTIHFYEFPPNLMNLILLRYLALTCNANLPRSVSNLWNLQYLIIHQHLRIKSMEDDSCLPMEIWDLKELIHLQITGRNLPEPPPLAVLPKLTELLDVGVQSCTANVLQSVPNLEKLRVQMETAENLSWFDHISCLHQLRSLQSVVMYPHILPEPIVPPPPFSISTSSLQKLSLEGFGFAWMEMSKIAKLPNLEKLILQCYAFQGEKWDANEIVFSRLCYLCIEDTDLVQWKAGDGTFPRLRRLTMKNCYNVEEIPVAVFASNVKVLESSVIAIELVDCNPLAETWAKQWCHSVVANYSWK